jgi:hypothetical protein
MPGKLTGVRRLGAGLVLLLAGPVAAAGPIPPAAPAPRAVVQGPADEAARAATFGWTLYPGMWAELDLRIGPGGEAVADVLVEGGAVSWDLHTHPGDAPGSAFVRLEGGTAQRATVRCAPATPGWYSYLFRNAGPDRLRVRVELRLTGDARLAAVKP